jgi:UDP-N-acetyl-D-glucosamine dehydrogenase
MISDKLKHNKLKIGIFGLGYVGLPLLLNFAEKNFKVIGFDIDNKKVKAINAGQSYIEHISPEPIKLGVKNKLIEATSNFSRSSEVDALIICVPTPLNLHHEPDLSYVVATIESILPYLRKGQIVSLESTTYPGTTEEEICARIEKKGLKVGKDINVVFSPEREDPGNPQFNGVAIPKVVGGSTSACLKEGLALYGAIYPKVVPVSSTQVAEFTKLLENIYRAVNIGLVNEMKIVADRMGIDIWEVIEAAATKPFGFKAFYPGPGLGGHCIPIDPFYLTWKAREYGIHTRFIELAGEINESMPEYVVQRCIQALNTKKKALNGSKILLMGLAYKSDVDDMRESPTFKLMDLFDQAGAKVSYYDPHIPVITPTREHAKWTGLKSTPWTEKNIKSHDLIVISTNHKKFNLDDLVKWGVTIVDTRNALVNKKTKKNQVIKA